MCLIKGENDLSKKLIFNVLMPLYNLEIVPEKILRLSDEIAIIPRNEDELLKIEKDYELQSFQTFFQKYPKYCIETQLSLTGNEWVQKKDNDELHVSEIILDLEDKLFQILSAFRVLKDGEIHSNRILFLNKTQDILCCQLPQPLAISGEYRLHNNEIDNFLELYTQILNIQKDSIDLALRWFNKSYAEPEEEDSLIDLMIAFESLVFEGEQSGSKGKTIAIAVSMLIGKNEKERRQINDKISECYTLRNKIVHGSEKEVERELILELSDYFRRSLKKLLN